MLFWCNEPWPEDQLRANPTGVIAVGGALGQIDLGAQAYKHLPPARVKAVFEKHFVDGVLESPSALSQLIGTVQVNGDWFNEQSMDHLVRCGNDCE